MNVITITYFKHPYSVFYLGHERDIIIVTMRHQQKFNYSNFKMEQNSACNFAHIAISLYRNYWVLLVNVATCAVTYHTSSKYLNTITSYTPYLTP